METSRQPPPASTKETKHRLAVRIHLAVLIVLGVVLVAELVVLVSQRAWMSAFLVVAIMTITLAPAIFRRSLPVYVPSEFQLLAIVFVFASLFLGEIHSYYERIWWWDIALHASSGLLLGILGFLLVYVLNENERVDVHMRPRFVAFFAFLFAVAVGAVWEIFEFTMDRTLGTTMQKPMLGDSSGLTDTMWDLIVDTLGALIISGLGWSYMRQGRHSFIERWIRRFIERNPHMFTR